MGLIDQSRRKINTINCERCHLKPECLPSELSGTPLALFERKVIRPRQAIKRGEVLVRQGDPMHSLYALRIGSLKVTMVHADGTERVLGFRFPGAIIGLAEPDQKTWTRTFIALEDTWRCEIPVQALDDTMNQHLIRLMSRRLLEEYTTHLTLATTSGAGRIASFLLRISIQVAPRGQLTRQFRLPMPYGDIANYLGMRQESLSRICNNFCKQGLILKFGRHINLVDVESLRLMSEID
ncbi:helix-turn-helix domain-containing protein [Salinisphaera sp. SWV1]|uniref:helix-turn-helix domain-containing protein n=1 Tax=Salinisphaera sp. SWV1 TaxID=3454139 RepID=UPI003F838DA8